uniref:glutamine--tRNA ligase n=1 Tax=Chromera velia CCMP2878 TaxID=1169474 RepID=A0A0G4HK97_9ALVE|eukprot:Cvel_1112.t1-p1 / transcript=Cvel_1112.t1 / gene=Cvel_1112 / organism=Chromera_velia_CCMP2878 / gene_product=Glutamine--tRNA ligase, putative / transcript_product=Glutamine--tRNA ligase, putative / location=Cvel_scaffold36:112143-118833(-) / protein_length=643 / sequence_SO=supercontig / SO=protein_coding / is_pseudo=false
MSTEPSGTNDASSSSSSAPSTGAGGAAANNFVRQIVEDDLKTGKHSYIITRFPPEPNGFLHVGHAKSICLNFGLAKEFGGRCHLRFDDTNPAKEEQRYIDSIQEDVRWLGFDWGEHLYYASDYFEQLYEWAEKLIKQGDAFVDDQTLEEIRATRGDIFKPGTNSPFRDRSPEENLDLFRRMRKGEFPNGAKVLRAKIDMADGNMNMRDPVIYRILHESHPRTGDKWCIYPMYDFAHGQEDSIEKVTHSVCTLEFRLHRPLYEWLQEKLDIFRVRQIEFARLNVTGMMMSKRKLLELVNDGVVRGWDDPRMPTLSGLRRRGFPPAAVRDFCKRIGVAERENVIQLDLLENCVREELHHHADRRFAVHDPLRVVIVNYPEDKTETFEVANHPDKEDRGKRKMTFSRNLYISRDDFKEEADPKFFRLAPGKEVRLRFAYWAKCVEVIKDDEGNITEVHCTYDENTKGGEAPPDGRKVKGTLHWVDAKTAVQAEFRLYDRLFLKDDPDSLTDEQREEGKTWRANLNPNSMKIANGFCEPSAAEAPAGASFQFERVGFFCVDPDSSGASGGLPVFNKTVGLTDSYAKESGALDPAKEAQRLAREKAAEERAKAKAAKEAKAAEKAAKKAAKKAAAAGGEGGGNAEEDG